MRTYAIAFLLSLGLAALLTPVVLRFAVSMRLYDIPDGERKIHAVSIPRLGGIAITLAFTLPLVGMYLLPNKLSAFLHGNDTRLLSFVAGLACIVGLGIADDLRGVGAKTKLAVQSVAAVILWSGGISFDQISILGNSIELGSLSLGVTILWVTALVNAMNLIDGLDGLAAGVAFFASFSLFIIALIDGNAILACFSASLAGAVLGFLLYNFSPALIFMGDTGSMVLGYVFAACGLWATSKRSTALSLLLPMVALGVPIFDTIFAFSRRALSGRSPFSSDRGHIHHRLMDLGLTQRQVVLTLYLICVLLSAVAVTIRATDDLRYGAVIVALVIAMAGAGRALRMRAQAEESRAAREQAAD